MLEASLEKEAGEGKKTTKLKKKKRKETVRNQSSKKGGEEGGDKVDGGGNGYTAKPHSRHLRTNGTKRNSERARRQRKERS